MRERLNKAAVNVLKGLNFWSAPTPDQLTPPAAVWLSFWLALLNRSWLISNVTDLDR